MVKFNKKLTFNHEIEKKNKNKNNKKPIKKKSLACYKNHVPSLLEIWRIQTE
jgi:hypothetical protein